MLRSLLITIAVLIADASGGQTTHGGLDNSYGGATRWLTVSLDGAKSARLVVLEYDGAPDRRRFLHYK